MAGYKRVIGKPDISGSIRDRKRGARFESVGAKRRFPGGFTHIEAVMGFEPLSVRIDQADQGNGGVDQMRGNACQTVKTPLRGGV